MQADLCSSPIAAVVAQPRFLSKKEREELAKKEAEEAALLQKAKYVILAIFSMPCMRSTNIETVAFAAFLL